MQPSPKDPLGKPFDPGLMVVGQNTECHINHVLLVGLHMKHPVPFVHLGTMRGLNIGQMMDRAPDC